MLVARVHTAHVDLLPLNWHIVGLEDCLDRLGNLSTNTVTFSRTAISEAFDDCTAMNRWDDDTWNQGDSVFAAVLGWLENIRLDGLDGSQSYKERLDWPPEGHHSWDYIHLARMEERGSGEAAAALRKRDWSDQTVVSGKTRETRGQD